MGDSGQVKSDVTGNTFPGVWTAGHRPAPRGPDTTFPGANGRAFYLLASKTTPTGSAPQSEASLRPDGGHYSVTAGHFRRGFCSRTAYPSVGEDVVWGVVLSATGSAGGCSTAAFSDAMPLVRVSNSRIRAALPRSLRR